MAVSCTFVVVVRSSSAQPSESSTLTWKLVETDCMLPEARWVQKRVDTEAQSAWHEQIFFQCGSGTKILVSHPVPAAFVISELTPSLRIKATRNGIRLMARVVLPHSDSSGDGQPTTTMLAGPEYTSAGQWQTLSFTEDQIKQLLEQQIWVLRHEYGPQVSIQNAYVDQVILNLYTSRGTSTVAIADVKTTGVASADAIAKQVAVHGAIADDGKLAITDNDVRPAGYELATERQKSLVVRNGSVLEIQGTPFFPRIVQHNGEPFEFLKSIGFNTLQLRASATGDQLATAKNLDMWIVCPAPPSAGVESIPFSYDRVLAWSVGEKSTGRDLDNIQQSVHEIRQSDLREGRPIVADIRSHWNAISNEVDIVSIGVQPIGSSFIASGYSDWIRQRGEAISSSKPIWVDIQTQFPTRITNQITAITAGLPPLPLEPQQLKFLVYEAISGGVRGLRFLSHERLDNNDPMTLLRALTLRWLMRHVRQLEPWPLGGALMGEIDTNDRRLKVTALKTNRSRLLLIERPTHHEQHWAGDVPPETIAFRDSGASFTDRVYQISEAGVIPISSEREPLGIQIKIEDCPFSAAVVMTQDSLVLNRITNLSSAQPGEKSTLDLHTELTRQWIAILQLIDGQLSRINKKSSLASGALNESVNLLRLAADMQAKDSPSISLKHLEQADERLAFARRELLTEPLGQFQSKTSSPLLLHPSLAPLHWQLAERLTRSNWNPNSLAGGDFEDLRHLTDNGWTNQRNDDDSIKTQVDLSKLAAADGAFGLRLSVTSTDNRQRLIQSTPVWITSGKVPVRAGQLVRIHGWVNVPNTIVGSHDGLMITDSLGGFELAERIPFTNGWQEFTLYRGASKNTDVTITFALTGIGEAMVDEVTVRTIDLQNSKAAKSQTERKF